MNRVKYTLLALLFTLSAWAKVEVRIQAPEAVVMGEQFRFTYVVNKADVSHIEAPDFIGFNVLNGPSTSVSQSVQIINGKYSNESSVKITYILEGAKEGTHTIAAAQITVDGKAYSSKPFQIRVLPAGKTQGGGQSSGHTSSSQAVPSGKELFMTVSASKKRVYEQEAILLTYKVYSLVDLRSLNGKMPSLDGFHTQEIPLPSEKSMKLEHHNGQNYRTVTWLQYVLFPQKTGKLTIPSIKFDGTVMVQNRHIDPFEAFFGGAHLVSEVQRTIVAPSLTIQVDPLPTRPANFSGAVGNYSISASLTPKEVKANDALTLRLTVSGQGNMKLINAPELPFPKDFETYDAKITDKTSISASGNSGEKIFEYLAVPRHAGSYDIPPIEFCYFDPSSGSYKTVQTESFHLDVAKGEGSGATGGGEIVSREELTLLNSDVRHIKTGETELIRHGSSFFGTTSYLLSYLIPLLLFITLVVIFRKQARENANVAKQRGKKASKVASRRLKTAKSLLREGKDGPFYDEVLKALWGYVGDKLNMAVVDLNKENVKEELLKRGAQEEDVKPLLDVLNDCEFARFAPGKPADTMERIFASATEVINRLEDINLLKA